MGFTVPDFGLEEAPLPFGREVIFTSTGIVSSLKFPAAMIAAESGGIGGHITALGHEPNHYTMFYVDVDDVAAYLEKAKALGGKTLVPPVEIPTGTFAWMQDPEGNTVGLWKAKR